MLFPPWILPRLEAVLEDAQERADLQSFADGVFAALGFGLADIQIMNANAAALNQYNGLRVTEAAERAGMDPFDFYCRMVIDSKRMARVLIHTYSGDSGEEDALARRAAPPAVHDRDRHLRHRRGPSEPGELRHLPARAQHLRRRRACSRSKRRCTR